jgi:hypothetical protein
MKEENGEGCLQKLPRSGRGQVCKKFLSTLICCLWQPFFVASDGVQVARLRGGFLSDATSVESAPILKTGVERLSSEIAKGVRDEIVRF